MKYAIILSISFFALSACQHAETPVEPEMPVADQAEPSPIATPVTVPVIAETTPTLIDGAGDPALWINADDPGNSLLIGSSNEGGIEIYSLQGSRIYSNPDRPVSQVDVHYNFPLAGEKVSLVVAYDLATAGLVAYTLDPQDGGLTQISDDSILTEMEVEGLCLYHSPLSGKFYTFVAGDGQLQQWEMFDQSGQVSARLIRTVPVGFGASYCVVQDAQSALFLAQETVGVWKLNAEPESEATPEAIDLAQPFGNFSGDIKGLALVETLDGGGYLLASDADVSRVQIYALDTLQHVTTLETSPGGSADAAQDSEGIAAIGLSLSSTFPQGLVVLGDDDNEGENTNFKLISWKDVVAVAGLKTTEGLDPTKEVSISAVTVSPSIETTPVTGFGDAADDPAIWVHPTQPELSLVIGTQKKQGLNVYDLSGQLLQSLPDGRLNNVDLRYGFLLNGEPVDVLTGSNRSTDSISIYTIDPETRLLRDVAAGVIPTGMADPYGLCMYHSRVSGNYFVLVNDTDGVMKQWLLVDNGQQQIDAQLVREFAFESQTEGCVVDDETGTLYVGEEDVGIWKLSAEPDGGFSPVLVDSTTDGNLTDDVEGLSLYYGAGEAGYLVASNQGADSYALYERAGDNAFVGLFHVVADEVSGIDGASETDGLDVTSAYLGESFPHGVLVVQDGRNITPDDRQNFKLVPWERIAEAFGLPLSSGYDPRAAEVE